MTTDQFREFRELVDNLKEYAETAGPGTRCGRVYIACRHLLEQAIARAEQAQREEK